jgi:hypothetical protein
LFLSSFAGWPLDGAAAAERPPVALQCSVKGSAGALHRGLCAAWNRKTRRKHGPEKYPGCDQHDANPP